MRDLLPPEVAVAVAGPADWTGPLLAEESACLHEQAVESRRRDFTAGRVCARRALTELGLPATPVPSAADRAPIWPSGVVGSITHTTGFCAAVAARTSQVRSIGIDAEWYRRLEAGVQRMICLPEELDWCARQPGEVSWPTVIFSVKETIYKIWHPVVGSWLDFHEAQVDLDPVAGTFTARIVPARVAAAAKVAKNPPSLIRGRFILDRDLVRTAAVLPIMD